MKFHICHHARFIIHRQDGMDSLHFIYVAAKVEKKRKFVCDTSNVWVYGVLVVSEI